MLARFLTEQIVLTPAELAAGLETKPGNGKFGKHSENVVKHYRRFFLHLYFHSKGIAVGSSSAFDSG